MAKPHLIESGESNASKCKVFEEFRIKVRDFFRARRRESLTGGENVL